RAQSFESALARFAADSFSETEAAITEVAASGHPMAARVILALQDARLLYDPQTKKVFIRESGGEIVDAASGATVASAPDGLKTVRINNRLRRAIEAVLGMLTLLSPDPAKRLEA